ncbi:STAS domain-containing protein [Pseudoxanthomonas taiwanensis]|jgi:Predicted NTP binding protein (contains STAS domain)|uniref:Anti-sigma B factor antagonist n=1 Tax=Pseudoxanthomonas taiwanensis TaxID=176598 RepID=A0A921NZG1_9GAMM|nr:STAS domain-containing protein [Pseudoxanthomonas taiwanensis]KAF1688625.1 anti-sigma B factor antagonist [Pseudoxanthomonas taiwanensis]MBO2468198.1 anti-sigma B factor antagonist [Xanthomonadaceae bacterium]
MPARPEQTARVRRDGQALRLEGRLDRAGATALWPQAQAQLDGARTLDLSGVEGLDSAGLALLAELAARLRQAGPVAVTGTPPGLAELCAAYRLDAALDFIGATP